MKHGPNIATVSALAGDPARANILTALIGGQALTANELALEAGVTAPTASGHLARLLDGGLVAVAKQGRHRYYRLANPDIAAALESLMTIAELTDRPRTRLGPKDPALRRARVCYDHLAGELGVALFARLCDTNAIALSGGDIRVTPSGEAQFFRVGIDVGALRQAKRPICRSCLDWSERTPHLAGSLGTALLNHIFAAGWATRLPGTRIVRFTPAGERAFASWPAAVGPIEMAERASAA
ncbi:MAG TPA: helix-turn-helix transcriptional regulator [Rhodopila sp.]|uniref:ArsR/SmtB family transcription factor n=1 Tax=Rhodopila sp. TaxID=2480087 RepID=UPI002C83134E|nr:helix-turn-helix transcriptional regulator [Rhodopila sp.]HVY17013.1 helix-turn-helix transcriptional regulator [Rhodopila sp.]